MNPLGNAIKNQIPEPILNAATVISEIWENSDIKQKYDETNTTGLIVSVIGGHLVKLEIIKLTEEQQAAIIEKQNEILNQTQEITE